MSYTFVSDVLRGCFGIDPSSKLIVVVLAEHANEELGGVAWPSVATIAHLVGLSERQVQFHLRELTRALWIFPETAGGGRKKTTAYRLNLERMRAAQRQNGEAHRTLSGGKGEADITVSAHQRVKLGAQKGEAQRQERVKPASPEPEVNQKEPEVKRKEPEQTVSKRNSEPATGTSHRHPYRTPEQIAAAKNFFAKAKRLGR